MKSPRKSIVSYRIAANLFFALAAIVIALAAIWSPKPAAASEREINSSTEATKKEVRKSSALNSKEWLLLAKVM